MDAGGAGNREYAMAFGVTAFAAFQSGGKAVRSLCGNRFSNKAV